MYLHANAKLGLAGRLALVRAVEDGLSLKAAAAVFSVSPATAHRWWHRWKAASEDERASRSCLRTRSSRPRSCPWALSAEAEQAILTAREKTNYGPMQLQFLTGRHRSTIWKVLARRGKSRRRRSERARTSRRYEWAEAGALLHIDAFELPRFDRPGHWATGQRAEQHKTPGAGKIKIIGVIDDHTGWRTARSTPPKPRSPSQPRCDAPPSGSVTRAADPSKPS
jgi:transposase